MLQQLGISRQGLLCSALCLRHPSVDVATRRGSFLTFPLEKRHDGSETLNAFSAHWHHPVDSRLSSFKCICTVHSSGQNLLLTRHRRVLSNGNLLGTQIQVRGHIVNKRLTSGLLARSIVGNSVARCGPLLSRKSFFNPQIFLVATHITNTQTNVNEN